MSPNRCRMLLVTASLVLSVGSWANGQGLLVDRRAEVPIAGSFQVERIEVNAEVKEQVAQVRVSQTLSNPTSRTIEAEYLFPVPNAGAIQNVVLLVDGTELVGEVLDANKAKAIYEEIVRRKRDPALLEYMGRGLIKTSVFPIPAGAERTVTMTYTELLKRDQNIVEFSYPFGTQKFTNKPIETLDFSLKVKSQNAIQTLYSPSHPITTSIQDPNNAIANYRASNVIPTADLQVFYTVSEGGLGASVFSYRPESGEDGYFLLLASPEVRSDQGTIVPKTVIFVLDRSGSMSGKKIEQARKAVLFVLDNLNVGDTFNIIVYDDRIETYAPELQRFSPESRVKAGQFVDNIRAGGSTNIDSALRTAMEMLNEDSRPQYVLFMTDGLPTAGVTNELEIAERAANANKQDARLFPFGVGFDVNARLLDRLSAQNHGASEYVTPEESIEASVARFYSKITSPALSEIEISLRNTSLNRMYPREIPDLFEGGQLTLVGRYNGSGKTELTIRGTINGDRQTITIPAELAEAGSGSRYEFVEPLWAARRVGDIIDQIDLHGESTELTQELVELSKKYGILTPYTAFLANEETDLFAGVGNTLRAREQLVRLEETAGRSGVGQRSNKAFYKRGAETRLSVISPDQFLAEAPGRPMDHFDLGLQPADNSRSVRRSPATPSRASDRSSTQLGIERQMGQAGGRFGGGLPQGDTESRNRLPSLGPVTAGVPVIARDFQGNEIPVGTVRQLGRKTFYYREGRWLDSEVEPEQEKTAKVIEQFSETYFKLSRGLNPTENQCLTFKQPVVVHLRGKVYRIEPPKVKTIEDRETGH